MLLFSLLLILHRLDNDDGVTLVVENFGDLLLLYRGSLLSYEALQLSPLENVKNEEAAQDVSWDLKQAVQHLLLTDFSHG